MSRPAVIAAVCAVALLAGCSSGSRPRTITAGAARAAPPPVPSPTALTVARQLRSYGVAVAIARQASRLGVRVSVMGSQGYGVDGLRVRVAGTPATPCGHGCYAGSAPIGGSVQVEVNNQPLDFPVPRPPFRPGNALLARIDARYLRARTAVFDERLSSGPGQTVTSSWRLAAPDSLSYVASDGSSGVIIGGRRWDKQKGGRWEESPQAPKLPQPALPWPRSPANVMELDPGTIGGRPVVRVSFLDPNLPAWYTVSADPATHELVRIDMVAPAHFMRDDYHGLDVPVKVTPP